MVHRPGAAEPAGAVPRALRLRRYVDSPRGAACAACAAACNARAMRQRNRSAVGLTGAEA